MEHVKEKFMRYVRMNTESVREADKVPSTETQRAMAEHLKKELEALGVREVRIDEYATLYGKLPPTKGMEHKQAIGFIAHMDTTPEASGKGVNPQIVSNYDGGDILLSKESGRVLSPAVYGNLRQYQGEDLIVTDGTTLLGADDKAGIAEIMAMVETLTEKNIPHGPVCVSFTPDEEVGGGIQKFDVKGFGAKFAYTVDGGQVGEVEYESFNAADLFVTVNGLNVHTGEAKHKMKNALLMGIEFNAMLPAFENPACTEGYEGFFHLFHMEGNAECAKLHYLVRDHSMEKFQEKKKLGLQIAAFLNAKYGENTVAVNYHDSYANMRDQILPHMHLVDYAAEAMKKAGVEPRVIPIRGGTDGSHLSFMGLPCPNLSTGGHNAHGYYEYIPVSSLEKMTACLLAIVEQYAERPDEQ